MAKFAINKLYNSNSHKQEVEADAYLKEEDFFVFYEGDAKVLTIAAALVKSIDKAD